MMLVNGLGRNEQSLLMTLHRCFQPSFGAVGKAVSQTILLEIDQLETRIAYGGHVCQQIRIKISN